MKIAIALALAMIAGPVLAQSQPFNPSGPLTQGYAVLVDGSTGLPYVASGGGGGGGASANAAVAFRQTCTASAVQMASNTFANGAVVKALITNGGTAYIGPSGVTTSTGYPLTAGEAISYGVANSNQLYLICSDATSVIAVTGN